MQLLFSEVFPLFCSLLNGLTLDDAAVVFGSLSTLFLNIWKNFSWIMNRDADSEFAYLQQLYNWFIVNFLARFVNSFAVNAACVKHLILI